MGLRFRKSIKVAPGVKVNLNKKSVGVTLGTKGVHYTINSNGKQTKSVGIPGTGLSYTTSSTISSPSSSVSKSKQSTRKNDGNTKNSSCFVWALKIIGIIILLSLMPSIGWIIGIIWLIFFRKNLSYNPAKQKACTIIVALLSVLSFILMCNSIAAKPSAAESVNIENQEAIMEPDIENTVSNDSEPVKENVTAEKKEEKSEESIVPSPETSDDNSSSVTEKLPQEPAAAVPVAEAASNPVITTENIKPSQEPADSNTVGEMVWKSATGSKYHSINNCGKMNPDKAKQVSLEEALELNLEKCDKCY